MGKLYGCFHQLIGNSHQLVVCWARLFFSSVRNKSLILSFCYQQRRGKITKDFRHKAQNILCSPASQSNQAVFGHFKFLFRFLGLFVASNASETSSSCNLVSHVTFSNAPLTGVKKKRESTTPHFLIWDVGGQACDPHPKFLALGVVSKDINDARVHN